MHSVPGSCCSRGRYQTTEQRNAIGTFTFADLEAYAAGRPTTFSRTIGGPAASDRAHPVRGPTCRTTTARTTALTLSGGVRQEYQSAIGGLRLAPRGGVTWAPFKSGRTSVRGGAGIFFDWFEAENELRAAQLDGMHQQVETVLAPGYPFPLGPSAVRLANGRIQLAPSLDQPTIREASLGVEQALGAVRFERHGQSIGTAATNFAESMSMHRWTESGPNPITRRDHRSAIGRQQQFRWAQREPERDPPGTPVVALPRTTCCPGRSTRRTRPSLCRPTRERLQAERETRRSTMRGTGQWVLSVFLWHGRSQLACRSPCARRCRPTSRPGATTTTTASAAIAPAQ